MSAPNTHPEGRSQTIHAHGHTFTTYGMNRRAGKMCHCGLSKSEYTLRLCSKLPIPYCFDPILEDNNGRAPANESD